MGRALSPFSAFLLLSPRPRDAGAADGDPRGQRHDRVLLWLEEHPAVSWSRYAGAAVVPFHELGAAVLLRGLGAVFAFGVAGPAGTPDGVGIIESLEVPSHLATLVR